METDPYATMEIELPVFEQNLNWHASPMNEAEATSYSLFIFFLFHTSSNSYSIFVLSRWTTRLSSIVFSVANYLDSSLFCGKVYLEYPRNIKQVIKLVDLLTTCSFFPSKLEGEQLLKDKVTYVPLFAFDSQKLEMSLNGALLWWFLILIHKCILVYISSILIH